MYKAIVKQKDMDDGTLVVVIGIAEAAENSHNDERQIATEVKQAIESNLPGTWQVVVGRTFGSTIHHENNCFAYLYVGRHAFLLWRSPVPPQEGAPAAAPPPA